LRAYGDVTSRQEGFVVKARVEDLPAILATPAGSIRELDETGMTFTLIQVTEGDVDLGPLLAGFPGDLCPIPHWGYVIQGAVHARFADGHEREHLQRAAQRLLVG
jgi:hypothetical protein